ncbi:putative RNA-directed DNA polymerase from transposon X-element [Trichonephila inaurata madagascariensis]|uniref:Putative RNA-directed DNA polymerase from transposon X-element n=1 Tax=Trichonephila inaurata madagascariensis TaxID=2747483 RepID=A0A8X7BWR1_9ARAC|nr:putative RNA-directed DNA polymerase from transposon X-element [Trichonephila inaurata madagascariensis]
MAAQGSASLASNQTKNSNKAPENTEAINAIQSENSEFGYLQALLEIQKIFSLFPSLLSEMKKSHNFTNPADKLNCLLKGVCSSFTTLSMIKSFFGLSIFSWNADGVRSRIVEIRDFVDKHSPDILLLQETHLRPEHSFKIPNYICYRTDRTHPAPGRGGTAFLIKNCISHYHVPTPPPSLQVSRQRSLSLPPLIMNPFLYI